MNISNKKSVRIKGHIATTNDQNRIGREGAYGHIIGTGDDKRFIGSEETTFILSYYKAGHRGECYQLTGSIGKNGLKPDTWYVVRNGKFVEWEA